MYYDIQVLDSLLCTLVLGTYHGQCIITSKPKSQTPEAKALSPTKEIKALTSEDVRLRVHPSGRVQVVAMARRSRPAVGFRA